MKTKTLSVYYKHDGGTIERRVVNGMTQEQHQEYYNIGDKTGEDQLLGWPEQKVEWHGDRFGYGVSND